MRINKIFILISVMLIFSSYTALAKETVITQEDFEKYNLTAEYGKLSTITMDGVEGSASMASNFIINGPGSNFDSDYEGNAAQNLITYARTGDNKGIAVPGGLNNGWQGRYSTPMTSLAGLGGADSDYNQWNRRCSVQSVSGKKILSLLPQKSSYVDTFSLYAYDDVDFSKYVVWTTKLNIKQLQQDGKVVISLTSGKMSAPVLFTSCAHDCGRTAFYELVEFTGDKRIKLAGIEKGSYSTGAYYDVNISVDAQEDTQKVIISVVKDDSTQVIVAQTELEDIEFSFEGKTGVEYCAYTMKGASTQTRVDIDEFKISQMEVKAELSSDNNIKTDGTGICTLSFDSEINPETINNSTIKVLDGTNIVEGVGVSLDEATRKVVTLTLPQLKYSTKYSICISGVKSSDGVPIYDVKQITTVELLTLGSPTINNGEISISVENNSIDRNPIDVILIPYKDGLYTSGYIYYKTVEFTDSNPTNVQFDMTAESLSEKYVLYFIDNIKNGFRAIADSVELMAN